MFASLGRYFTGVYSELKKTNWPNRQQLINYTIIVVVSSAIAIGVLTVIDLGLTKGVEYLVAHTK